MTIKVDISPSGGGTVEINGEAVPEEINGDAEPKYPAYFSVESSTIVNVEAIPEYGYRFVNYVAVEKSQREKIIFDQMFPIEAEQRDWSIIAYFAPDSVEFVSEDGMLSINIPYGVTALDGEGNPLTEVEFAEIKRAPDPPEDYSIIGLPYQLKPEGTTFDQPVMLTWRYDTGDIPEGIAEEELLITRCDNFDVGLPEMDFEVDAANDTISAYIEHFSCFTVLALVDSSPDNPETPSLPVSPAAPVAFTSSALSVSPQEVSPGAAVTISALLINPGEADGSDIVTLKINGVVADTRKIDLAGGAFQMVTFTTAQSAAGTYQVEVNSLGPLFFTVKEGDLLTNTTLPSSPTGSERWPIIFVIIAVSAAISIPLGMRWWRRRSDLGSLGDYISMR
ncbi:MAG: hypothetical protein PHI12_04960 [Dehalococcoidales bacterium]|nr:hypothetical protein [Dehalococcoidales bacterium]